MPHIRKHGKICSGGTADDKKKSAGGTELRGVVVEKRKTSEVKGDAGNTKADAKTGDKKSAKGDSVLQLDGCVRNGIIHFPIIPGLTLHKKKSGKHSVKSGKPSEDGKEKEAVAAVAIETRPVKERRVKFSSSSEKELDSGECEPKQCYPHFTTNLAVPHELLPPELILASELVLPPVPPLQVPDISLAELVPEDPISACLPCLEANGTYICTPCNPRCYIIQKV